MTQEDKELLLKDLCGRLPYGVKCQWDHSYDGILIDVCKCKTKDGFVYWDCYFEECDDDVPIEIVKPYLRPISDMTEEEDKEFALLQTDFYVDGFLYPIAAINIVNWLNAHHFDYRGLIEKGLALEASKEMF